MNDILDLQSLRTPAFMWVFRRNHDRLEISHEASRESTTLLVNRSTGENQTFRFDDHASMVTFQVSFTEHLLQAGWHFVEFLPERRAGHDRRQVQREGPNRRRFTTVLPFRPRKD
jgi:hypothetical protein